MFGDRQAYWHLVEYLGSVWQGGIDYLQEVVTQSGSAQNSESFFMPGYCVRGDLMVIFAISERRNEACGEHFPKDCIILLQSLLKGDCSRGLRDGSVVKSLSGRIQR